MPTLADLPGQSNTFAKQLATSSLALARRFADGATMWCIAPGRSDHALHIAVEFVHPVIVGKPALPAVAVVEAEPAASLRSCVRPGDVVVCVGSGNDADLLDVALRVPAWGVDALWIGWGPRPSSQSSATPIWLPDDAESSVVRSYHLLWELTHVCLEHTHVLGQSNEGNTAICRVCVDDLTLVEVIEAGADTARVRSASGTTTVDTTLLSYVETHDLLLVQAGVALQSLDTSDDE